MPRFPLSYTGGGCKKDPGCSQHPPPRALHPSAWPGGPPAACPRLGAALGSSWGSAGAVLPQPLPFLSPGVMQVLVFSF